MRKSNNDTQRINNFLKELGYLLSQYKDIDFKEISNFNSTNQDSDFDEYMPENKNKQFLIGCLPNLFLSKEVFPTNTDIGDFVRNNIPGYSNDFKRDSRSSRTELIGRVVCGISSLKDNDLQVFTTRLKMIIKRLNNNEMSSIDFFTEWNKAIYESIKGDNNK